VGRGTHEKHCGNALAEFQTRENVKGNRSSIALGGEASKAVGKKKKLSTKRRRGRAIFQDRSGVHRNADAEGRTREEGRGGRGGSIASNFFEGTSELNGVGKKVKWGWVREANGLRELTQSDKFGKKIDERHKTSLMDALSWKIEGWGGRKKRRTKAGKSRARIKLARRRIGHR